MLLLSLQQLLLLLLPRPGPAGPGRGLAHAPLPSFQCWKLSAFQLRRCCSAYTSVYKLRDRMDMYEVQTLAEVQVRCKAIEKDLSVS